MSLQAMPFEEGASSSIFVCFGQIIAQNKPAIVSFYEKRAIDREKHHVVLESSLHASLDGVNQSQALVP